MIRSEQMNDKRNSASGNGRRFAPAEEILETRGDRRRTPIVILDLRAPAARKGDVSGRDFIQHKRRQHGFDNC
jgi:hypothetical protein